MSESEVPETLPGGWELATIISLKNRPDLIDNDEKIKDIYSVYFPPEVRVESVPDYPNQRAIYRKIVPKI